MDQFRDKFLVLVLAPKGKSKVLPRLSVHSLEENGFLHACSSTPTTTPKMSTENEHSRVECSNELENNKRGRHGGVKFRFSGSKTTRG